MNNFTIFYIAFIIVSTFTRLWKKKEINTKGRIQGKIYAKPFYGVLFSVYFIVLLGSAIEYFALGRQINLVLSSLGLITYIVAGRIRKWAIDSLGKYWSVHIEIRENHKLIKNGPYSYLRHPNSLCVILEILSVTLIPNSYYTFFFALFVAVPIFILRMHLEEGMLLEKFGEEYIQYRKEVWALLPLPIGKARLKQ